MRTSATAWVGPQFGRWPAGGGGGGDDPVVANVLARASELLRMPAGLCEGFQVLQYKAGEHYWAHADWQGLQPPAGERFATLLYYLSSPSGSGGGGHTVFPLANPGQRGFSLAAPASQGSHGRERHTVADFINATRDKTKRGVLENSCEGGLHVEPELGTAVFFYNVLPGAHTTAPRVDNTSFHVACDVEGSWDKWACNNWFRTLPRA